MIEAGLILQLDCPDLAMGRHHAYSKYGFMQRFCEIKDTFTSRLTEEEFLRIAEINISALNSATANIPADKVSLFISILQLNYQKETNFTAKDASVLGKLARTSS